MKMTPLDFPNDVHVQDLLSDDEHLVADSLKLGIASYLAVKRKHNSRLEYSNLKRTGRRGKEGEMFHEKFLVHVLI